MACMCAYMVADLEGTALGILGINYVTMWLLVKVQSPHCGQSAKLEMKGNFSQYVNIVVIINS